MIHVRSAGILDTGAMAELLNEIIEKGGTTAMTKAVSRDDLSDWMRTYSGLNSWNLAEDASGALLGFQWIEPRETLPDDACDIATFTKMGRVRMGCGSALFNKTKGAAKALGYRWINATIRADNSGGLAYYQSRGFETYATQSGVRLANGLTVDKVSKRYDL